jgi:kinetochor protein Mis14/NSL1
MDATSVHRKIELQTPEDLAYLIGNVQRAAQNRLDEAFPPVAGADGEDELRTQIEALVNEVRIFPSNLLSNLGS